MTKKNFNFLYGNETIRNLILENPDLPLIFFVSEEANNGEYYYMTATNVHACVDSILIGNKYAEDCVLHDDDELEDKISDAICDKHPYCDMNTEEFNKAVSEIAALYQNDWIKVIAVYVE